MEGVRQQTNLLLAKVQSLKKLNEGLQKKSKGNSGPQTKATAKPGGASKAKKATPKKNPARPALPSPSKTDSAIEPSFTYNATTFLLHGEPYQIIGGQMDPQRIPHVYWRDRLRKVRAMGINTVFSYIFWDQLQPVQSSWTSNLPENDIASYFKIAQEEDLNVILRPGPYICGEHEWGGFPSWLSEIDGMVVRSYNEPFLKAAEYYLSKLADDIRDLQVTRGGPLLMVQVENEYGSFGHDHRYTGALADMLRQNFEVPLYTNDGTVDWTLHGGEVPGVLAEIDGDPQDGWEARKKYITDPTEQGPFLDGEYYTYAPDQWGSNNPHNTTIGEPEVVKQFTDDIDYVLGNKSGSISFYMVHGGTNFGFQNGALWQNRTTVFTSSYDYSSPIDESGRATPLYHAMRKAISKHVPEGSIPDIPPDLPRMSVPEFSLSPLVPLFDVLGEKTSNESPLPMEALGQGYGFILYEHTATSPMQGVVHPGDRPRDRVIVYVNGISIGVTDSQYQHPLNISVSLKAGDKLQLLVENLGRVDYFSRGNPYANHLWQPHKGIVGEVAIGGKHLSGWDMYPLPLEQIPSPRQNHEHYEPGDSPMFFHGSFHVSSDIKLDDTASMDTFLALPNGVKGQVWVNGFNLGRYWLVGPQQSLYLPGTLLKRAEPNEVVVLELEPALMKGKMTAVGMAERHWGNHPDPDCLKCI